MTDQGDQIDIGSLTFQQLEMVKGQVESEIQKLTEHLQRLQAAVQRFHLSGTAVQALSNEKPGKPMLVPLTSSLYVPGKTLATDTILVDIGTGYYVEKTAEEGADYAKRKVMMLKESMDKLMAVIREKNQTHRDVQEFMQVKLRQAQMQEQQAQQEAVGAA